MRLESLLSRSSTFADLEPWDIALDVLGCSYSVCHLSSDRCGPPSDIITNLRWSQTGIHPKTQKLLWVGGPDFCCSCSEPVLGISKCSLLRFVNTSDKSVLLIIPSNDAQNVVSNFVGFSFVCIWNIRMFFQAFILLGIKLKNRLKSPFNNFLVGCSISQKWMFPLSMRGNLNHRSYECDIPIKRCA